MTAEISPGSGTTNYRVDRKDDDPSTPVSTDADSMKWGSTEPNSLEEPSSQTPHTDFTTSSSLSKMSLDFIAPRSQANSIPSPVSSARPTPELDAHGMILTQQIQFPRPEQPPAINVATTSLPSPVCSTLSDIPHFIPPPPPPTPSIRPSRRNLNLSPFAPNRHTSRRHKRSNSRLDQREDRHPYDTEEKYAIIYLRVIRNLKWDDVLLSFHGLFPPGEPRRCHILSSPEAGAGGDVKAHANLPSRYMQRNVQGLQCRWYRIRKEEGLVNLRESRRKGVSASPTVGKVAGGVSRKEKKVLERMERAGVVGRKFLESVNGGSSCARLGMERVK